jgi:hypothetical protein
VIVENKRSHHRWYSNFKRSRGGFHEFILSGDGR